jgi:hypothetical protein
MLRAAGVAQVSKPADGPKARPEADWVSSEATVRQSALRQRLRVTSVIISRVKEIRRLETLGLNDYDWNDAINSGVADDELAGTSQHVLLRRIIDKNPASGQDYEFATSKLPLPPGVLCYLYRRRWDIENSFDEYKNKLG